MAEDTAPTPVFQIQRIYLKDLSLEQPNSPTILLEQKQPQVEINLNLAAAPVSDGIYEVCVTATVTTKIEDKTLFLIEAKQAGIFEIRNLPEEQLQPMLLQWIHLCHLKAVRVLQPLKVIFQKSEWRYILMKERYLNWIFWQQQTKTIPIKR